MNNQIPKIKRRWTVFSCLTTVLIGGVTLEAQSAEVVAPPSFQTNCIACHELDRTLVGPSLAEISELYPEQNRLDFIKWCVEPGKKRDLAIEMPSMAHIPEEELSEIFDYIKMVSVGVTRIRNSSKDLYADRPEATRRPRVERTFLPHTGPASILVALPTKRKDNLVWDTDKCRLRYISEGETDRWPYLRSNGNALATVGDICYEETVPLFKSKDVQFKGYRISKAGYPTFIYTVDGFTVKESISVEGERIMRTITGTPRLPEYEIENAGSDEMETERSFADNVLTITHCPIKK